MATREGMSTGQTMRAKAVADMAVGDMVMGEGVRRSGRRGMVAAFALALLVAAMPAHAQEEPRNRLPDGVVIDPEIDPAPFDVLKEVRNHLLTRIGTGWWIGEPERMADSLSVRVHVPTEWRGNPVSAMLPLCPEPGDEIWNHLSTLQLQPFYQNRPWAEVTCWR